MKTDILALVKNRRSIRKYKDIAIPNEVLEKIIEAGIWGPSLMAPGFQPWRFIVVSNPVLIKKIGDTLLNKSKEEGVLKNTILRMSANTILGAKVVVVVYSNSSLVNFVKRIRKSHVKYARTAEFCAISAAIQNMILTSESLGVGSCWFDSPLFCKREVNKVLGVSDELIAILSLGYPNEEGCRSVRKPLTELVEYR